MTNFHAVDSLQTVLTSAFNQALEFGDLLQTAGYHYPADGGNNLYIVATHDDDLVYDGGFCIRLDAHRSLLAVNTTVADLYQFGATGSKTGNDTDAVQRAIKAAERLRCPVRVPAGHFVVGNVRLPAVTDLQGAGPHKSFFHCALGTNGAWFEDEDNAVRIKVSQLSFYGDKQPVSSILRLGHKKVQWGTFASINDVEMRDGPQAIGLDINQNVSTASQLNIWRMRVGMQVRGNGFDLFHGSIGACTERALVVHSGHCCFNCLEFEAPLSDTVIQLQQIGWDRGTVVFNSPWWSLAPFTNQALIQTAHNRLIVNEPRFNSKPGGTYNTFVRGAVNIKRIRPVVSGVV